MLSTVVHSTFTPVKIEINHLNLVDVGGDMVRISTSAFDPIFW